MQTEDKVMGDAGAWSHWVIPGCILSWGQIQLTELRAEEVFLLCDTPQAATFL